MMGARYFDGKTAKAHAVELSIIGEGQEASLRCTSTDGAAINLLLQLSSVQISERQQSTPRRITIADGGLLEVLDNTSFQQALDQAGFRDSFVVKAQSSWRWIGASFIGVIFAVGLMFLYGVPLAAKGITYWLPESADTFLGDQAWPLVERELFTPSKLSKERQDELSAKFADFVAKQQPDAPKYQLEFRRCKLGPNAIAMPGGRIVLADELVKMSTNDDALIGVLAHELGHVKHRHSMRNIVQASAVTAFISMWLGDVSSLVALVPSTLATLKYSRDLETEADDYAVTAMRTAQISTQPMADLFAKLPKEDGNVLMMSHPITKERIKKFSDKK